MMRRYWIGMALLWLLAACSTSPSPPPTATAFPALPTPDAPALLESTWPSVELIARAASREAPATLRVAGGSVFTWTGAQENEARHYSRGINGNAQIMALRAYFPLQQRLFPAQDGVLLLWLDRTPEHDDLRLQSAVFSRDGIAEIGAIPVSNLRTEQYDALQGADGVVTAVWSGGLGAINNLYFSQIDDNGRPLGNDELRVNADHPALLRVGDVLYLFWLEDSGRAVYTAQIVRREGAATLADVRRITRADRLRLTDALDQFTVGYDGTTVTLFWNVRHLDGTRDVLFSSGTLSTMQMSEPRPLGISLVDGTPPQTALPLANLNRARYSAADRLNWAAPLSYTGDVLPVVVNRGEEIGVLLLQQGAPVAYERIATSGRLIAPPRLQLAPDGHLSATWAVPRDGALASLYHTTTRP